jgi:hypothetical protein
MQGVVFAPFVDALGIRLVHLGEARPHHEQQVDQFKPARLSREAGFGAGVTGVVPVTMLSDR